MCGIAGALGARVSDESLGAALAALRHRGPDAEGRAHFEHASLGHRRLAVIDLSPAGEQPMFNDDRSIAVVFNGEIYNHHALRRELESQGARFVSRSDTEVIVRGYEHWGDAVVARLDGMFALALYDSRKQRSLLARDRAGKKPLFYASLGGRLVFGSEIKALTALGVRADVEKSALPYLLLYGYVPSPLTLYREVKQLPPAHLMVVEEGLSKIERYWSAPFTQPTLSIAMPEAAREVRRLVEQAVSSRLEADVPLGAFLSGGVDSTIVVGVMSRLLGRKVKTFSIGFAGDARYDETHYARLVARAFDTEHTEFTLQPSSFDLVEKLVALHDGPFGDSSAIPTSVVSMLTREHVTVALSGDGGDELFCGYPRFLAAEAAERVPPFLRSVVERLTRALPASHGKRSLGARSLRFLKAAHRSLPDRLATWTSVFVDLQEIVRPELGLDLEAPWNWNREIFAESGDVETMRRILHANFRGYLPEDLLVKTDRASMAHALEVRSPFLDTELIAFASRLPPELLRKGVATKRVLREAFADLLPPAIQKRAKMGFGVPLGAWFRGELRDYVRDRLTPQALVFEYLQHAPVARLLREHESGKADHGQRIWLLLTLEVWLQSLRAQA